MNKRGSHPFWILGGAYLIYLGYSLIKGHLVEHEVSVGFMAVGILFGALGLYFCVMGLKGRGQTDQEMEEEQEPGDAEAPALEDGTTEEKEEEEV